MYREMRWILDCKQIRRQKIVQLVKWDRNKALLPCFNQTNTEMRIFYRNDNKLEEAEEED